jgi:hypothetical protein
MEQAYTTKPTKGESTTIYKRNVLYELEAFWSVA